jgi:GDP-L-fucose synthase
MYNGKYNKKMIFIAGHKGLVGSSIFRILRKDKKKILLKNRKELNLENFNQVDKFFKSNNIKEVYLCAAKVGGIYANSTFPYDFINSNLLIQSNIVNACLKYGVKKLLFLGSSCIYPRDCKQPIKEKYLLSGNLEYTNRPYAVAKIAGIELLWACNKQFNTNFIALMPTNLYGPDDNFHQLNSHVIPGVIKKVAEAIHKKKDFVEFWGTGKPKREFLYSDDLAIAAVKIMNLASNKKKKLFNKKEPPLINVGSGNEIKIKNLCTLVCKIMKFKGKIKFNSKYPDGTPRKILDSSKFNKLINFNTSKSLEQGLKITINSFLKKII